MCASRNVKFSLHTHSSYVWWWSKSDFSSGSLLEFFRPLRFSELRCSQNTTLMVFGFHACVSSYLPLRWPITVMSTANVVIALSVWWVGVRTTTHSHMGSQGWVWGQRIDGGLIELSKGSQLGRPWSSDRSVGIDLSVWLWRPVFLERGYWKQSWSLQRAASYSSAGSRGGLLLHERLWLRRLL